MRPKALKGQNQDMEMKCTYLTTPDLSALRKFFKKNYQGIGQYGSMDFFQWKIINNATAPSFMCHFKDGETLAATTVINPKRLYFCGGELLIAELTDVFTDSDYQRKGLCLQLLHLCTAESESRKIQFIFGTPTPQAFRVEQKAGYELIPNIDLKNLRLRLNIKPAVEKRSHWLIATYANTLFLTFLQLYLWFKFSFGQFGSVKVTRASSLPDEWNSFWERARQSYDFIICRDKKALTWRFFENPESYQFYIASDENEICGYLVCRVVGEPQAATLVIADYLVLPGKLKAFSKLLYTAIQAGIKINAAFISTWCPTSDYCFSYFRKLGIKVHSQASVIYLQNKFSNELLEKTRSWHFTTSDTDNI